MRSRRGSRGTVQLQPCIAELLRTFVSPPSLLLRVERITEDSFDGSRRTDSSDQSGVGDESRQRDSLNAFRLLLGDGVLMIQSTLERPLHDLIESQVTVKGSLIELRKFRIQQAPRTSGKGKVVYLAIADYERVGTAEAQALQEPYSQAGGFLRDEQEETGLSAKSAALTKSPATIQVPSSPVAPMSSQESDSFETTTVDLERAKRKREALREVDRNSQGKADLTEEDGPSARKRSKAERARTFSKSRSGIISSTTVSAFASTPARVSSSTSTPLTPAKPRSDEIQIPKSVSRPTSYPRHTLLSLLQPPTPLPTRSYPCTVLAVVSWVSHSLIHQSHTPFPPKRHVKIHDPSITARHSGITVAVFVDAKSFVPKVGTVALFRGVTMQTLRPGEEVMMNAYSSLKDAKEKWYVDDRDELEGLGYDVAGMVEWWEKRRSVA